MTVPPIPPPVPMPKANPPRPLTRLIGYDADGLWATTTPAMVSTLHEAAVMEMIGGALLAGGEGNALTLASQQHQLVTYGDGLALTFRLDRLLDDEDGALTLDVNGLGAKPVYRDTGRELVPADALDISAPAHTTVRYLGAADEGRGGWVISDLSAARQEATAARVLDLDVWANRIETYGGEGYVSLAGMTAEQLKAAARKNDNALRAMIDAGVAYWAPAALVYPMADDYDPEVDDYDPWLFRRQFKIVGRGAGTGSYPMPALIGTTLYVVGSGEHRKWVSTRISARRTADDPADDPRSSPIHGFAAGCHFEDFLLVLGNTGWTGALHTARTRCTVINVSGTYLPGCAPSKEMRLHESTHSDTAPPLEPYDGVPLVPTSTRGADQLFEVRTRWFGGDDWIMRLAGPEPYGALGSYGRDYKLAHKTEFDDGSLPIDGTTITLGGLTLTWRETIADELVEMELPGSAAEAALQVETAIRVLIDAEILEEDYPVAYLGLYHAIDGALWTFARGTSTAAKNAYRDTWTAATNNPGAVIMAGASPVVGDDPAPYLGQEDNRGTTGMSQIVVETELRDLQFGVPRLRDIREDRNPWGSGQNGALLVSGLAGNSERVIHHHMLSGRIVTIRPIMVALRRTSQTRVDFWFDNGGSAILASNGSPAGAGASYGPIVTEKPNRRRVDVRANVTPNSAYFDYSNIFAIVQTYNEYRSRRAYFIGGVSVGQDVTGAESGWFNSRIGGIKGQGGLRWRNRYGIVARIAYQQQYRRIRIGLPPAAGADDEYAFDLALVGGGTRAKITSPSAISGGISIGSEAGGADLDGWSSVSLNVRGTPKLSKTIGSDPWEVSDGIAVTGGGVTVDGETVARLIDIPDFTAAAAVVAESVAAASAASTASATTKAEVLALRDVVQALKDATELFADIATSSAATGARAFPLYVDLIDAANNDLDQYVQADVYGDTEALNGRYRKLGAAGSGGWSRFTPVTFSSLAGNLTSLSTYLDGMLRRTFQVPGLAVGFGSSKVIASGITHRGAFRTPTGIEFVDGQGNTVSLVAAENGVAMPEGSGNILTRIDVPGFSGFGLADRRKRFNFAVADDGTIHIARLAVRDLVVNGQTSSAGGGEAPKALANLLYQIAMDMLYGQSNATGVGSDRAITTSAPGGIALTFNGGVRPHDSTGDPDSAIPPANMTSFVPFAERRAINGGETMLGGAIAMQLQLLEEEDGITPAMLAEWGYAPFGFAPGRGGQSADNLKPGSIYYNRIAEALPRFFSIAAGLKRTASIASLCLNQGEANSIGSGANGPAWTSTWDGTITHIADDQAAQTGVFREIETFVVQVSSHEYYGATDPVIAQAQLEWCRTHPHRHFLGPTYHVDHGGGSHYDARGHLAMGARWGLAKKRVIFDGGAAPHCWIERVEVQGDLITLYYSTDFAPVVLDRVWITDPGNAGFRVRSPGGTVRPITHEPFVSGPRSVTFACPTRAVGDRVEYGHFGGGTGLDMGRKTGSRGCVRDSMGDRIVFGRGTFDLRIHNWAPIETITLV